MVQAREWFDLSSEIKRRYATRSWIPLKIGRSERGGEFGESNYYQIYEGVHTLLIPVDRRDVHEYEWMDDSGDHRSYAYKDDYKPVDVYQHNDKEDFGTRLILRQVLPGMKNAEWHVNQDLIFALGLVREGDVWVRPYEGFIEVIRLERDASGEPEAIAIRAEFLRDYLCARQAALRICSYRERDGMISPEDAGTFVGESEETQFDGGRLSKRVWETDNRGGPAGGGVAVFRMFRTDIDPREDVPVLGPETDANTGSEQRSFVPPSTGLWRAIEEYWRDEWLEPAVQSPRVRSDRVPSAVSFVVEADGTTLNADELNHEDIGRWLWFNPAIIPNLLQYRGNELKWYTKNTGGIRTPSDPSIHFGINEANLITVYAEDIASLSEWERKLWAGHNVTPEGGVAGELIAAQVEVRVADTKAPEEFFSKVLEEADEAYWEKFGEPLFRAHENTAEISSRIHRFRSLEKRGLFELAKDITRLTADLLNVEALRRAVSATPGDKRGSLKLLENLLSLTVKDEVARKVMGPIFGAYELRLADAHMPKTQLQDALGLVSINEADPPLARGFKLLHAEVLSWNSVLAILRDQVPDHIRRNP